MVQPKEERKVGAGYQGQDFYEDDRMFEMERDRMSPGSGEQDSIISSKEGSLSGFADHPGEADDEHDSDENDPEEYASDGYGGEDPLGGDDLPLQDSVANLVPIEFAKAHIAKIEEDMKNMHERHVKLMREMDQNYKMIEKETQEYYIEFLQKWREVAKSKITQYRRQSEQFQQEKEALSKEKEEAN